jgi:hypothetical protein
VSLWFLPTSVTTQIVHEVTENHHLWLGSAITLNQRLSLSSFLPELFMK